MKLLPAKLLPMNFLHRLSFFSLLAFLPSALFAQPSSTYSSYSNSGSLSSYSSSNNSSYYAPAQSYTSTFSNETPPQTSLPSANPSPPSSRAMPSNTINWLSNYAEASALAQSTSKPIVILFTGTSWCPACIQLERNVLSRPEFASAVSEHFIFLKAEFPSYSVGSMNSSSFKPLLDRYGVNAFPTMVVVDSTGRALFTVNYRDSSPQAYAQELLRKAGKA